MRPSLVVVGALAAALITPSLGAQCDRPGKPAELAFLKRTMEAVDRALPAPPAGWKEYDRRRTDTPLSELVTQCDGEPLSINLYWELTVADIDERAEKARERMGASVGSELSKMTGGAGGDAIKRLEELTEQMTAAASRNDQAAMKRIEAEMQKAMAAANANAPTGDIRMERCDDCTATVRITVNASQSVAGGTRRTPPAGAAQHTRLELDKLPHNAREGISTFLVGRWSLDGETWKLAYPPNQSTTVHGFEIQVEAKHDRAVALFGALRQSGLFKLMQAP